MTTTTNGKQAIENVARGIGSLVWWTLRDSRIKPDALRMVIMREGGDASAVPDLDAAREIRRAARSWTKGRGKADRFRASFPEGTEDDSNLVPVTILKRKGARGEFLCVDEVEFDVKAGVWTKTGNSDEATEFMARADEFRTYLDHDWIRPHLLVKPLKAWATVTVKDDGGLYYLPTDEHDAELERIKAIIRQIGSCRVSSLRITPQDTDAIEDVREATTRHMGAKLSDVTENLDRWVASSRAVSETNAHLALTQLAELKAQAHLYRDALGMAMTDLDSKLSDAETTARTILEDARAQPDGEVRDDIREALKAAISNRSNVVHGQPLVISADNCEALSLPVGNYAFWNTRSGDGFQSAKSLGWMTRMEQADGERRLVLTPMSAEDNTSAPAEDKAPEPVQPEPVAAPEPVAEIVEPKAPALTVHNGGPDNEARAKLAHKSDAQLQVMCTMLGLSWNDDRDAAIDAIAQRVA
jgi:hypothetical protein